MQHNRSDTVSAASTKRLHAWVRRPSFLLRSVGWFGTDVSAQRIGAVFEGSDVQEE
jgi:hypothetical protein